MFPKLISLDGFFLPTYGVLVALGFLAALWIARRLSLKAGLDPEAVTNLGVYCAVAGLLGAKLMMLVFDWSYYAQRPAEIFTLRTLQAGGVFQGGLIAALLTAAVYTKKQNLPRLATADVFAPGVALGHGIGRLGCFAAGCCWGVETRLPWAVTFTRQEAHELVGVPLGRPLHPTQLYESAAEFLIFAVLYRRFQRPHREGAIIGMYLALYGGVRFLVEFVRYHQQPNPFGGPLSATQWLALVLGAAGLWLWRRRGPLPAAKG